MRVITQDDVGDGLQVQNSKATLKISEAPGNWVQLSSAGLFVPEGVENTIVTQPLTQVNTTNIRKTIITGDGGAAATASLNTASKWGKLVVFNIDITTLNSNRTEMFRLPTGFPRPKFQVSNAIYLSQDITQCPLMWIERGSDRFFITNGRANMRVIWNGFYISE